MIISSNNISLFITFNFYYIWYRWPGSLSSNFTHIVFLMYLLTFFLYFLWEFLCVPYTLMISNNCYQMCIFSKYNFPEPQIIVSYSLMNISTQMLHRTSTQLLTLTDLSLSTIWIHLINLSYINHTVFQKPRAICKASSPQHSINKFC